MSQSQQGSEPQPPEPDAGAIQEQLERVLAHAAFKNSRRSQALLRYIVEHRNGCDDGHLKERTLGTEVFGREPSYDTNADPVVRIVAGEVRKRIAQYYHEPGREGELRIELPLGSYRPEFHAPAAPPAAPPPLEASAAPPDPVPPALKSDILQAAPAGSAVFHTAAGVRPWLYALPGLVLAAVIGLLAWGPLGRRSVPAPAAARAPSALARFWQPLLDSPAPVQIGVGPWPGVCYVPAAAGQSAANDFGSDVMRPVGWWDFQVAAQVAGLVQQNGRVPRIEAENATSLRVLSQGPAVLIGANNNSWVMKLTQRLRFHFVEDGTRIWIADRDAPDKKYLGTAGAIAGSVRKYGLIARLSDPTTGQIVVILAGAGQPATFFAGEMATNPQAMEALARQLPSGWERKNLEVVVGGPAIGGQPGAPQVVASYAW